MWGWHGNTLGYPSTCNSSIPSRHRFIRQLLYFQCSSLHMAWGSSKKQPKALDHESMWETQKTPQSWFLICLTLALAAVWELNRWMEDLFSLSALTFSVSLSLFKSVFSLKLNKSFKKSRNSVVDNNVLMILILFQIVFLLNTDGKPFFIF